MPGCVVVLMSFRSGSTGWFAWMLKELSDRIQVHVEVNALILKASKFDAVREVADMVVRKLNAVK